MDVEKYKRQALELISSSKQKEQGKRFEELEKAANKLKVIGEYELAYETYIQAGADSGVAGRLIKAEQMYSSAIELPLDDKWLDSAIVLCNQLVELYVEQSSQSHLTVALRKLGEIYTRKGDKAKAIEVYEQAMRVMEQSTLLKFGVSDLRVIVKELKRERESAH